MGLHLEQAETGRDTRSNGLSEKLERGIARADGGRRGIAGSTTRNVADNEQFSDVTWR